MIFDIWSNKNELILVYDRYEIVGLHDKLFLL